MRRRRLIADGMEHLRQHDPGRLDESLLRVRLYDASLERFGLRARDVDQRILFALATRFVVREGLLALEVLDRPAAHRRLGEAGARMVRACYSAMQNVPKLLEPFERVSAQG